MDRLTVPQFPVVALAEETDFYSNRGRPISKDEDGPMRSQSKVVPSR